MRVVFKCSNHEFFNYMLDAFRTAKEFDNWDLATLKITENRAEYITCCKNVWFIEKVSDGVLFGYEGTRAGAIRLQPFAPAGVRWHRYDPPVLEIVLDWEEYITVDENGREVGRSYVSTKVKRFELKLVEYETTTPKRWKLEWYHQIERIPERSTAVIMSPHYPLKIVRYKNVYLEKALEKMEREQNIQT
ncbi:MAG: hypothetical protein MRT15_08285 [archaeon YNP-LCB-003-016]|uniref:hypothetical protein n=1 Tax=Candidatus Culexarchaeum yellowstonense TaxID=2928963 RepID=UPI0026EF268A|nr:hypothetical protein [Candidatus Culexarchaeum yellowstonense]MCR6692375.1 hypothetical protein [Candidatus Culexarchaeum yellowstonense]